MIQIKDFYGVWVEVTLLHLSAMLLDLARNIDVTTYNINGVEVAFDLERIFA